MIDSSRILIAGGRDSEGNVLSRVDVYDMQKGVWEEKANMLQSRSAFGLTKLGSGSRVTAVGGMGSDGRPSDSAEELSEDMTHWNTLNLTLEVARTQFSLAYVPNNHVQGC